MNQLLIKIIYLYKKIISPYLSSQCRYSPSCSSYALDALREYKLYKAIFLILIRIAKCNPLFSGGYDPVRGMNYIGEANNGKNNE